MRLDPHEIAITGMGMVSSLGLDVVTSCAAARAGISRISEVDNWQFLPTGSDEPEPLTGHSIPLLTNGFEGQARLLRLGSAALEDLLKQTSIPEPGRTAVYLNVGNGFYLEAAAKLADSDDDKAVAAQSLQIEQYEQAKIQKGMIAKILKTVDLDIPRENQFLTFGNQAGIAPLLEQAAEHLRRGNIDQALIGGIDSLFDSRKLTALNKLGILKTPENPRGFLPGDMGCWILLEKPRTRAAQSKQKFYLDSVFHKIDKADRFTTADTQPGKTLSATISECIESAFPNKQPVPYSIGNLNGDAHKSMEWGQALTDLKSRNCELNGQNWFLGSFFGEIGSASGTAAICLAARTLLRTNATVERALIWLSGDDGLKTAISLRCQN